MGLKRPNANQVTREDVHTWLQSYQGQHRPTKALRTFLQARIQEKGVDPDLKVDTTGNDSLEAETPLVDMILMDIENYAP